MTPTEKPVADPSINEPMETLARRGSAALVGLVANAILAFVFSLVVTHELRPNDAGALFEALAILMIASSSALLGADVGLHALHASLFNIAFK